MTVFSVHLSGVYISGRPGFNSRAGISLIDSVERNFEESVAQEIKFGGVLERKLRL